MDSSKSTRRPCFIDQEDDGLSSLTESEPGFSGNHHHHFFSRPLNNRRGNFRTLSMGASRSPRFYDSRFEEPLPHFLDACFLCRKPLLDNSDIFMYRGDTPFCSEECRQEQIEIDETKEKKWKRASSMKAAAMRKKEQRKSVSPNKSPPSPSPQDYSFRASTIAAA